MDTLGQQIKCYRENRNLKQQQLAKLIGVERGTLSAYENDLRKPSYAVLIRIAEVLNVSIDSLMGRCTKRHIDVSQLTNQDIELILTLVDRLGGQYEL